jgi:hypothetical protein
VLEKLLGARRLHSRLEVQTMPINVLLTQIAAYCEFAFLITYLLRCDKRFDIFVLFLGMGFVLGGEILNLFISKMAVYNGVCGIPQYIILAGGMLVWGMYAVAFPISRKLTIVRLSVRVLILFSLSIFLPMIELFGLKTGLWYWNRPLSIMTAGWFLGVWKYYFLFLALPAILAHLIHPLTLLISKNSENTVSTIQ